MDIKNKVVLITGASEGIGKATAELFDREGARVALASRSESKLKEMAAGMKNAFVSPTDMSKPDQVRKMVRDTAEHYGRLDVLINNAARGMHMPIEHINIEDFAGVMALNVYGPIIAMQEALPIMRKQGGGAIVNISSMVTKNVYPSIGPYAATKCALNMITLTARAELASDNITVSLLHPTLTDTDFRKNAVQSRVPFNAPMRQLPAGDPPSRVAERILMIVQSGAAEDMLA